MLVKVNVTMNAQYNIALKVSNLLFNMDGMITTLLMLKSMNTTKKLKMETSTGLSQVSFWHLWVQLIKFLVRKEVMAIQQAATSTSLNT